MRVARLINLVMWLLRVDKVSATEVAKKFEVTTRTVYRDVDALNLAGIPVFTLRGRNGGIGLMSNYKVDKKLLTASDIQNLRLALGGVQSLIDSSEVNATLQKIEAMYAEDNDIQTILIDHTRWIGSNELKELAEKINQSIIKHTFLKFDYSDRNGISTQRKVEPYRLVFKGERWYLQAYSIERSAFRMFRLSRMKKIVFTNDTFELRSLPKSELVIGKFERLKMLTLEIVADDIIRDQFVERFGSQIIHEMPNNKFTAQIALSDEEKSYRFILSFGNKIKVTQGKDFIRHLNAYLDSIKQLYNI